MKAALGVVLRVAVSLVVLVIGACAAAPVPVPAAAVEPATAPSVTPLAPSVTPLAPVPAPAAAVEPATAPSVTPLAPSVTPLAPSVTPLPRYDLVLAGGTLIDGRGGPPVRDAVVAIRDGRIAAVGRVGQIAYGADTPVQDVSGATILPGFLNAHAHTAALSDDELRAWVRAGVTTLRDLGGPLKASVERRDRIAAGGDPTLPRLLVSGPLLNVPGSYSTRGGGARDGLALVDSPADARRETAAILDGGADLIKLAVSGRTDVNWPELSDAELDAIVATAKARGAHVAAHVDRASALRRAVLAGVDSAAHSPRDRIPDDLIALMVERGVALTPTIAVYEGLARERGNLAEWRRFTLPVMYDNLRRFAAAGGTLAMGDDYGGARGMTVGMPAEEIGHWLAAGLTPMDVIVASTSGAAEVLGLADELGAVAPGFVADLLVVDGDPLEDIDALVRPRLVIHAGRVVG